MLRHKPLAYGQPQPWSFSGGTESRVENVFNCVLRDSASAIRNLDNGANDSSAFNRAGRDVDLVSRRSVTNCIARDVEDDLAKGILVTENAQRAIGGEKRNLYACLLGDRLHKLHAALHTAGKRHPGQMQPDFSVEAEHVIDGSGQSPDSSPEVRDPASGFAAIFLDEAGK